MEHSFSYKHCSLLPTLNYLFSTIRTKSSLGCVSMGGNPLLYMKKTMCVHCFIRKIPHENCYCEQGQSSIYLSTVFLMPRKVLACNKASPGYSASCYL